MAPIILELVIEVDDVGVIYIFYAYVAFFFLLCGGLCQKGIQHKILSLWFGTLSIPCLLDLN